MNDKGAFFGREAAERYFRAPLEAAFGDDSVFTFPCQFRITNPESFLYCAYTRAALTLTAVPARVFAAIPKSMSKNASVPYCLKYPAHDFKCLTDGDADMERVKVVKARCKNWPR